MFDPKILKLASEQKTGIDIRKLPIGTKIRAKTANTLYDLVIVGDREVVIRGGRYFPVPTRAYLPGSTFGGSCMMLGWIGRDMHMELHHPLTERVIKTTGVEQAEVIGPDWSYHLDWQDDESGMAADEA